MLPNKLIKEILSILLKIFCLIIGLDIFLTSILWIMKKESNNKYFESTNTLNFKNVKYNDDIQFYKNIY